MTCSVTKEVTVQPGTIQDYKKLAQFHYREAGGIPPPRRIFVLKRESETVGVIVYSYPPITCFGRNKVFKEKLSVKELNEKLSIISRVVLHPKYRTIGLGTRLVKETLPLTETPLVEAVAVMAKYNPFFEKAGRKKIAEQVPESSCVEAVEKLHLLGFNPILLASAKHNLKRLKRMNREEVKECKGIMAAVRNPRLRRVVMPKKPYAKDKEYRLALKKTGIEKIARMLRVLSILMQTKVYLFWENPAAPNSDIEKARSTR